MDQQVCPVETPHEGFLPQKVETPHLTANSIMGGFHRGVSTGGFPPGGFHWTNLLVHTVSENMTRYAEKWGVTLAPYFEA